MPSLSPVIFSVAAARDGGVWIALGGVSQLVRDRGGKMEVYTAKDGLPEGGMRAVVERHDGTVWAGGVNGLVRLHAGRWERVTAPFGGVLALSEDREGHLWVVRPDMIFRYDDATNGFVPVRTELPGNLRFSQSGNRVVITGGGRVATMNTDLTDLHVSSIATNPVTGPFPALHDQQGHVWVGTNGEGLFRFDEPGLIPGQRYTERDGLAGVQIRALIEDREGNLWVGTHSGLTRITAASISQVTTRPNATSENVSTLVADTEGNVWAEVPGALVRIRGAERRVFSSEAGARFTTVTAMFANADGTWFATSDGRLTHNYHGAFQSVPREEGYDEPIVGISAEPSGRIWTYDGRFFRRRGTLPDDVAVVEVPAELRLNPPRFFHVDQQGRLWTGTDGGLVGMYDGGRLQVFGTGQGVPVGQLSHIGEDAHGRIWIAGDNGLSTFENGRFITLTTRNGLPGDRILFAIPDEAGFLWVGVGIGIVRIPAEELEQAVRDPQHRIRHRLYDTSDGLHGTPVFRGTPTVTRARDGSIWFVTTTGIAVVDPKRLSGRLSPPKPVIERAVVDGRAVPPAASLELPPHVSSLQIEYSALNLTSPSKVRFRHQLEGVDADWVQDGSNAQTVYANLAPGSYRFRLAASNGDDSWQGVTWGFAVRPAWYETRAFYIAAVAAIVLLTWLAWQQHVRQIQRRFALVLAERARVGREIHDTLLQSLVGMALQLDNLSSQLESPAASLKNEISRMRRQVEHYIEEAQQSIWELRAPRSENRDLPSMLREQGQRITENTGVAFTFTTTGSPRNVAPHVQQQVLRMAQEAVVNAVRHGHPTEVRMELVYEEAAVHLRVADNGHGFDPDHPASDGGGHWGLSIMRERAAQIGGSFAVSSAPDRGTLIDIVAPAEA
jgi:signal transduction histidine kinase/ligand-binding sensor domain-containing protein